VKATFHKRERLCSQTQIDLIFATGLHAKAYPLRAAFVFTAMEQAPSVRVMFVVPKRSFKRAVDRNFLKRRMREAYRLQKNEFYAQLGSKQINLAILYTGKEQSDYATIYKSMSKLLNNINSQIKAQETIPNTLI
jgi:ribonuclease P protein component